MSFVPGRRSQASSGGTGAGAGGADHQGVPGKRTLTDGLVVQRKATGATDAARTRVPPQCKLEVSQPGDAAEVEADAVASAATGAGGPVAVTRRRGVMLQREAIAGNKFGHWDFTQVNTNGANSSAIYASEVNIAFKPEAATADATEIAFVQNVQILDSGNKSFENRDNFKNRMTDDGSTIDRVADRKYGYYGYNNDGNASATTKPGTTATKPPTPATMYDKPSYNKPDTKWNFEAAVTAKAGADAGTIYGALQWGFDVDKDNKLTPHKAKHLDKQTAGFDKAVAKWNDQAKGDEGKRNHKDQVELGPFKSKT